jgi:hypothetical protein
MSIEITLRGTDPDAAAAQAAALLREVGGREPERRRPDSDDDQRRDLATGIAIASLILSLPGTVLATLQIEEQLDRSRLRDRVAALKTRLDATDAEATLEMPGARRVEIRRTSTDAIVDLLLRDLGARR